ncbi:GAF domain-containing sensor histidine kinase [Nannocystis sp. SCPEA4]|uniref:GAF domain-containing sensor histidine kinase n=1 Tax=Nannocystis sp. SCPEA4 TaxID=2996787 RepID=UPI0022715CCD|nr:GAF domain-containing sensor histidine kinase [Nannocystis sp. SCPEA4]MCY1056348.1 GAF domain-containing sensor histidine kinase [Nannocystis sp. SCPEA4]
MALHPSLGGHRQELLFDTLTRLLALPATTVEDTLKSVSNLVGSVLASDKVDAFLLEAASSTLVAVGTSDTATARKQKSLGLDRLPLANGGRTVEAFHSGEPYACNDVAADREELPGIREALQIRSTIAVPLDVHGQRRGVLQVASLAPDTYEPADVPFLAAVADWVGVVIHRAELVQEATEAAAQRARQRAAEELVAVVAHDLRNHLAPLTTRLFALMMRAERDGRDRDIGDLKKVQASLGRLERVITNLLDVERIERGLFLLKPEPIDLARLVRDTAALLSTPEHPVRVEAAASAPVEADPDAIRQVLENLLHNAGKHAPEGLGTTISVAQERREDGDCVTVRVHDAGPGIAPELVPKLFERFSMGPASHGLGLGLYLARSIAQAHGGTLTLEDLETSGACFCLALPLRESGHDDEADR